MKNGSAYDFNINETGFGNEFIKEDPYNHPRFYELKFMPVFDYEKELNFSKQDKVAILSKVINYLANRNIHVTFTDRLTIDHNEWEIERGKKYRNLPIAELEGNNICVNPRNIDFLSILFSIGHIYGHLVQRMEAEKYAPITNFIDLPKPLDLHFILTQYRSKYGRDYKEDFLQFEIEAFRYAKYTFIEAGLEFNELLDHAMNVYIIADFQELWRWVTSEPLKSGETFMKVFQELYVNTKGKHTPLEPKKIKINVVPAADGVLQIVRDEHGWN